MVRYACNDEIDFSEVTTQLINAACRLRCAAVALQEGDDTTEDGAAVAMEVSEFLSTLADESEVWARRYESVKKGDPTPGKSKSGRCLNEGSGNGKHTAQGSER